jgi:hypothetical protein
LFSTRHSLEEVHVRRVAQRVTDDLIQTQNDLFAIFTKEYRQLVAFFTSEYTELPRFHILELLMMQI